MSDVEESESTYDPTSLEGVPRRAGRACSKIVRACSPQT